MNYDPVKEQLCYACHLYLNTCDHASRKEDTKRAIHLLRQALQDIESNSPPTLGVSVSEKVGLTDKLA